MTTLSEFVNYELKDRTPTQIVVITIGLTVFARVLHDAFNEGRLTSRAYAGLWRGIRKVAKPLIKRKVNKAMESIRMPHTEGEFVARRLPEVGLSEQQVLEIVQQLHTNLDLPYENGGFSGTVYHGGKTFTQFINRVMEKFQWSNPLHVSVFGATRKMEAEVVSMVLHMYNGHTLAEGCGAVTSGGTESIMMAMRAYRRWAREVLHISHPSIVAPVTAHPAFDKAAEYFDMTLIKVPVNERTCCVDPEELEKYIRYDTAVIVGSTPCFPYGVVDDIAKLSEIAHRRGVGLHVDACLGGFIMPFIAKTGRDAPVIDFRNRGVTSISCDTHKYGCGPKGTSTILYRNQELRSFQFCSIPNWPGGMYCSPCVSGSKPGNVIAGAWAAMVHMGQDGYVEACNKILSTREMMSDALSAMPFVQLFGKPTASVFAFKAEEMDIFRLGDELEKRGWILNRLQFPSGLQFSVTLLQTEPGVAEKFVHDVQEIGASLYEEEQQHVAQGHRRRTGVSSATVYWAAQRVPDYSIINDVQQEFLNIYYKAERL